MSWGAYWMFYLCPACSTKFKSETGFIQEEQFGKCPNCRSAGVLTGESGCMPPDFMEYEEIGW